MIEGYSSETGVMVMFNPKQVASVYYDEFKQFCNVQMQDGTLHRFRYDEAKRVHDELKAAKID